MSEATQKTEKGPAFEWWMFSFIAGGAGWAAFISLLIPPYVTESTGNAADAGIVMAIISLAAVLGPVLGSAVVPALLLAAAQVPELVPV